MKWQIWEDGNKQIITERSADYYDEYSESFDWLEIPEHLQERFERYKM